MFNPIESLSRFLASRPEREAELMAACNHHLQRARDADARAMEMAGALARILTVVDNDPPEGVSRSYTIREIVSDALAEHMSQGTAVSMAVDILVNACHGASSQAGWWMDPRTGESLLNAPRIVPEKLMLVVSEVAEAMEGHRKGLPDDKLPHRPMIEVEIADAIIRLADLAGSQRYDLAGAVVEKMAFNAVRPDHKLEARQGIGGKAY